MRNVEELKNLQRLLRQLRCLWSFDTRREAQMLRTLQFEELEQLEELAMRALMKFSMRAMMKNWACG